MKSFVVAALALASLATAFPPKCKPATYRCSTNAGKPAWDVCNTSGVWEVRILKPYASSSFLTSVCSTPATARPTRSASLTTPTAALTVSLPASPSKRRPASSLRHVTVTYIRNHHKLKCKFHIASLNSVIIMFMSIVLHALCGVGIILSLALFYASSGSRTISSRLLIECSRSGDEAGEPCDVL